MRIAAPAGIWRETHRIRSYEVGGDALAHPTSILNLFQEVASNHAYALGVAGGNIAGKPLFWALSRLQVHFVRRPAWREEVVLETWPAGADRLFAFRDFVCMDTSGGRLAAGISTWLLIDPSRRRPSRMPPEIAAIKLPDRERALDPPELICPDSPPPADEHRISVRPGDSDANGHVNHVHYVRWMLDEVPHSVAGPMQPTHLDVSFRAESFPGDELAVSARICGRETASAVVEMKVRRLDDMRPVAIAVAVFSARVQGE